MADLSKNEKQALINKFRRNTYGKVSDRLIFGLIEKGLVDSKTRRLTEGGIGAVEIIERAS